MLELLRRWDILQPERCRLWDNGDVEVMLGGKLEMTANSVFVFDAQDHAFIQAAVQEAVGARNWIFSLCIYQPNRFHSIVTVPGDKPGDMPYHVRQARGDVAAQVLLGAYLQALENYER